MQRFLLGSVAVLGLSLAMLPNASAESFSLYEKVNPQVPAHTTAGAVPGQIDLTLGVGVGYGPEYKGSNDGEAKFLPVVDFRYQDLIFLTNRDGLGAKLFETNGFAGGVSILPDFGRNDGDNSRINGLGDIEATAEGGAFVGYYDQGYSVEARAHHDLLGEHEGFTAQIRGGVNTSFSQDLYGALDVYLDYTSEDYNDTYFGVNAAQAISSGLAQFDADGGVSEASVAGNLTYMLSPGWFVNGTAAYMQLLGDAEDSPVSEEESQFLLGVQSGYRF